VVRFWGQRRTTFPCDTLVVSSETASLATVTRMWWWLDSGVSGCDARRYLSLLTEGDGERFANPTSSSKEMNFWGVAFVCVRGKKLGDTHFPYNITVKCAIVYLLALWLRKDWPRSRILKRELSSSVTTGSCHSVMWQTDINMYTLCWTGSLSEDHGWLQRYLFTLCTFYFDS